MKLKFHSLLCALIALTFIIGATMVPASAEAYYDTSMLDYLLGSMEVVNCLSWTSLRAYPDSGSGRLAKVPFGAVVTDCYYYDEKYTYCVYEGIGGYILNNNLSFISGPAGYEYPESNYMGNYQIVNCTSYASLRSYPDTSAELIARVPYGEIVTNVFYQDDRFSYCMYGDLEGYILNNNLSWVSGGSYDDGATASADWIGDCFIVNCLSWASLRELPDTRSARLAKVPLGSIVTDCYYVTDNFACCTYNGITGYILLDNLGW
ncbi:MAG: SH3 domain-containing protein [Clostridia bacterium]|nr:SH3 domain-containing protein [Clostridia bacterium]